MPCQRPHLAALSSETCGEFGPWLGTPPQPSAPPLFPWRGSPAAGPSPLTPTGLRPRLFVLAGQCAAAGALLGLGVLFTQRQALLQLVKPKDTLPVNRAPAKGAADFCGGTRTESGRVDAQRRRLDLGPAGCKPDSSPPSSDTSLAKGPWLGCSHLWNGPSQSQPPESAGSHQPTLWVKLQAAKLLERGGIISLSLMKV